jgi:hypothetical protein
MLNCQCRASGAALVVLIMGTGIIPPPFVLPFQPITANILKADIQTLAQIELPETPPPRI